jgi:hypothetical protein
VTTVSIGEFARVVRRMPEQLRTATISGNREAALVLQRAVVEQITFQRLVDRGLLRNSVQVTPTATGATVAVTAPHAAPLEYGTRPHFPPVAPLEEWARRHGMPGAGFAIARKISIEGTPPERYFAKALSKAIPRMAGAIATAMVRSGIRGRANRGSIERKMRAAFARGGRR